MLYVGTSGFAYKEWKGSFYPKDLPAAGMLHYYAKRFKSVEINNSFYRMPKASVLEAWAAEVPPDFKFVLKAPQRITHFQRLKDSAESVSFLQKPFTLADLLEAVRSALRAEPLSRFPRENLESQPDDGELVAL